LPKGALVLGLVLSVVVGSATGAADYSFVAVMVFLLAAGLTAWLKFEFGIPLVIVDLLFGLIGLGVAVVDPAGDTAADLVRRFVGGLWTIGGIVGGVALIASTSRGDSVTDDVDSTAY
jgi:hypothetical protein